MNDVAPLLVEIGTEELPPKALQLLSEAFAEQIAAGLERAGLAHEEMTVYSTPRRLAVLVQQVEVAQQERQLERRGPALASAFDAEGNPTRAATGFASSCGLDVKHLERLETENGGWLVFRTTEVGQSTRTLIPGIVDEALARLPIPKRMRWADLDHEFVRPVHWAVLLFGDEVIEADIMGVTAGRMTRGHRFHHPKPIMVEDSDGYATLLYSAGHVMVDFAARRDMIRTQATETALELGGNALIDEDLLNEVTALVEWPVPVAGGFDEAFLELPQAVLIASMQANQKYFPVVDDNDRLLPYFVTISNIESSNVDSIRRGNERVLRPRLTDAAFFYKTDLEQTLESRLQRLRDVVFQDKLGSVYEKSERVSHLAGHVAIALGLPPEDVKLARRAGLLCKCDLLTAMVNEFPELQGHMGREYAVLDGEAELVAIALEEVYRPRYAGDTIPATGIGRAVAIADKLDTLVGIFSIGQAPTGDRDPFALRRAALGVLRVIIEGELDLHLPKLVAAAAKEFSNPFEQDQVVAQVTEFVTERLRAYFLDAGFPADVYSAVLARRPPKPHDFAKRIRAVNEFRQLPEAASLASANKRTQNILKKADCAIPEAVDDSLFAHDAEWNLAAKLFGLAPQVRKQLKAGDYTSAMTHLAGLRDAVDAFFDSVRVMDDNEAVRNNRLALLNSISTLFLETADISRLQT